MRFAYTGKFILECRTENGYSCVLGYGLRDEDVYKRQVLEELGKPGSLSFQDSAGNVVLEDTDVSDAQAGYQTNSLGNQEPVVQLTLTENGKIKFAEATKKAAPTRDIIYIIYDGSVVSAPAVQSEITDGSAVITGMGSFEEAETLASVSYTHLNEFMASV